MWSRIKKISSALLVVFTIFMGASCYKQEECYDRKLYKKHHDDFCSQECIGVRGCDGYWYCNECVANRMGVRVE